jgi:PhnB protein
MLAVNDCEGAIEFYKKAFNAAEVGERYPYEGKIGHAELNIAGALVMLADEFPEYNTTPTTLGGTPVILNLTVDDTDAWVERSLSYGAELRQKAKDEPYGRVATLKDPFGHVWMLNGPAKSG